MILRAVGTGCDNGIAVLNGHRKNAVSFLRRKGGYHEKDVSSRQCADAEKPFMLIPLLFSVYACGGQGNLYDKKVRE